MEPKLQELVNKLQEAHRADDRSLIEQCEKEFASQAKELIQEKVDRVKEILKKVDCVQDGTGTTTVSNQLDEEKVEEKVSARKANGERRRLYKELISIYRQARELAVEASKVKKLMREATTTDQEEVNEDVEEL